MRAAFNYEKIGERTIRVDCDIIQADGGTRCASITGAFIAVFDAINFLYNEQRIYEFPNYKVTAAISLGIKNGKVLLDLNYEEDSKVDVDFNHPLAGHEIVFKVEILEINNAYDNTPVGS